MSQRRKNRARSKKRWTVVGTTGSKGGVRGSVQRVSCDASGVMVHNVRALSLHGPPIAKGLTCVPVSHERCVSGSRSSTGRPQFP